MRDRINNTLKIILDNNEAIIYVYKSSNFDDLYSMCTELKNNKDIFVFYPEEKPYCLYDLYDFTQEKYPFLLVNCKNKAVFLCYEQMLMLSNFVNLSSLKNKIIILEDNSIRYKHLAFNEEYIINKLEKKKIEEDDEISIINNIYDYRIEKFLNGESLIYDYLDANVISNLKYEIKDIFNKEFVDIKVVKSSIEDINKDNSVVYLSQKSNYDIKCDDLFTVYEDNKFLEFIEKEKPSKIVIIGEEYFIQKNKDIFNLWKDLYIKTKFEFMDCTENEEVYDVDFKSYLEKYWKSKEFRNYKIYDFNNDGSLINISQEEILKNIVNEIYRCKKGQSWKDIFFIASTGSGKSLLYQLPSIILEEEKGMVIVISPLISLMKDQIYHLRNDMGINFAAYINSELSFEEREEVLRGIKEKRYSLVYVSPEFLQVSYNMSEILKERELGLVVVDEAHCVTNWGKEFRTDYGYLGDYIERLKKKENKKFPILALTATAVYKGELGTVDEIMTLLHFNDDRKLYFCDVKRSNIEIKIDQISIGKEDYQTKKEDMTLNEIKSLVNNNKAIVYTLWKSHAYKLYDLLDKNIKSKVALYLGDTKAEDRSEAEKKFKDNNINVMIATKAFGMGVDIDDIKMVYHHTLTGNVCDYVQEIGRAARNKNIQGIAYTYFADKDFQYYRKLKGMSRPTNYQLSMILNKINQEYRYQSRKNRHCREMNVPLESLAFAFTEQDRKLAEQKIRQALFLIDKDLNGAIKVYPKDDYSWYYCTVKEEMKEIFIKKYINYIDNDNIVSKEANKRLEKTYRWNPCEVSDIGDIFSFNLSEYWQNEQKDLSFRNVKRKFFNGELFDKKYEVSPRVKINITLLEDYDKTLSTLKNYVENLQEILKIIKNEKSYISKKRAEDIIKSYLREDRENYSEEVFSKTKHILFNLLPYNSDENVNIGYKLIVIKKVYTENSNDSNEKICVTGFTDRLQQLITAFEERFSGSTFFEKYIVPPFMKKDNCNTEFTTITMDLAYILEILNLGKFELQGGKLPSVNIYILQPMELYKPKYRNKLLKDMRERDEKEMKVMYKLINTQGSNEKWKVIEDYFLGNINIE